MLTRSFDPMEVLRLVEAEKITGITVVGDAIARPIARRHHRKRRALRPFDSPTDRGRVARCSPPNLKAELDNPTTGVGDQGCISVLRNPATTASSVEFGEGRFPSEFDPTPT